MFAGLLTLSRQIEKRLYFFKRDAKRLPRLTNSNKLTASLL
jgi:hypothetical protein